LVNGSGDVTGGTTLECKTNFLAPTRGARGREL